MPNSECESCGLPVGYFDGYCRSCRQLFWKLEDRIDLSELRLPTDSRLQFYGDLDGLDEQVSMERYMEEIKEDGRKMLVQMFVSTLSLWRQELFYERYSDCLTLEEIAQNHDWTIDKTIAQIDRLQRELGHYILSGKLPKRRMRKYSPRRKGILGPGGSNEGREAIQ